MESATITSKQREEMFLRLAARPDGTTAQEVFEEGRKAGDFVTVEAYHNLGRRLVHRGVLLADKSDRQTKFKVGSNGEGQWLDEDQIASIVNPDYPLIALTVHQEAQRQLNGVPESAWVEIRERLKFEDARGLFAKAIIGYCDNFRDEVEHFCHLDGSQSAEELGRIKRRVENELSLLRGVVTFGLGLSTSAVAVPGDFDEAVSKWKQHGPNSQFYDVGELAKELALRIEAGPLIVDVKDFQADPSLLIAAVDGSSRSGLLSSEGQAGDFTVGAYPVVSINTAVGQVHGNIKSGNSITPAFMRLPEKPEDMQQRDNRHTIMAKFFYPDITDGEYIHSVWNAMDVLESKATLRIMQRWYAGKENVEIRPADIVFRDGTVVPQERDFTHYIQKDSYGKITRDLIEVNWDLVRKCRDDSQIVSGVVKTANLRVFGPVINWFVCRLVGSSVNSQIQSWPLHAMNLSTDQIVLSRLLTANRMKDDAWSRTCMVMRPFHAVTKFAEDYSKSEGKTPVDQILQEAARIKEGLDAGLRKRKSWLGSSEFRGESDPYLQMLRNCWFVNLYVGCVPRLDLNNVLPRTELILPFRTDEVGDFPPDANRRLERLLRGIKTVGFDVAAEHNMFQDAPKLDILPSIVIRVHDTVKIWASELMARVNETIGYYVRKRFGDSGFKGVRVRRWTPAELRQWARQMQAERNLQAGVSPDSKSTGKVDE
jgi:hypothetical protein